MKGVKYNAKFKVFTDEYIVLENLTMKELCENIEQLFKNIYNVHHVKMTRQIVYNLRERPHRCCKWIQAFLSVDRINNNLPPTITI